MRHNLKIIVEIIKSSKWLPHIIIILGMVAIIVFLYYHHMFWQMLGLFEVKVTSPVSHHYVAGVIELLCSGVIVFVGLVFYILYTHVVEIIENKLKERK